MLAELARSATPLVIVAAVGRNGAIGRDNRLPWTLPSDLARFRVLTMGKPMIMGRRTFESIGRALPGRESIVVSRTARDLPTGVHQAVDAASARALAEARAAVMGADEIALIGGASLFTEMIPKVDRLHMTFVDLAPDADTFFPDIDPAIWQESARSAPARLASDEADCMFVDYLRV